MSTGTGVYESTDGGSTWTSVNAGLPSSACGKLLADPSNFNHLLVAVRGISSTGRVCRKPAGSSTWTNVSSNLTVASVDWNALAVDPSVSFGDRIWAGSATSPQGIYYTSNGLPGAPTWTARQTISVQGWASANPIQTNPASLARLADGSLWTGKNGNFHQSSDGGLNWQQRYTTKVSTVAAITPGANQGRRKADEWIHRGMCNTVENMVAVDPANPNRILFALADRGVFASSNGGQSFHQYTFKFDTLTGNSGFLAAFHPTDGSAYASLKDAFGSADGSKTTGIFKGIFQTGTQDWNWELFAGGDSSLGGLPKEALPSGIAFSPNGAVMWIVARAFNSSTAASRGVWESRDAGASWTQIGLSTRRMQCLAADPFNADVMLIGVRAGGGGQGVWRGVRSAGTWTFSQTLSVMVAGASVAEDCLGLSYDPVQSNLVYAAMGNAGFYSSTDGGVSWAALPGFGGAVDGSGARSITGMSPAGAVLGSSGGSFDQPARLSRSTDSGLNWRRMSPPFPEVGFLAVNGPPSDRYLYAATRGLGVWRVPLNYAGWKRQHFNPAQQLNNTISGYLADADFDGQSNVTEYALGSDPWAAALAPPLVPTISAGRLSVTYSINPAAADVTTTLQNSMMLPFSGPGLPVTSVLLSEGEMSLKFQGTDAGPVPLSPRFMRIDIQISPSP